MRFLRLKGPFTLFVFAGCIMYGILLCGPATTAIVSSSVKRLYVFGDSYSDIGAGYVDSNGPTAVAYLAERLGFVLLPSNALSTVGKSLDFAVSGAGTGHGAGERINEAFLGLGMRDQVEDFAQRVRSGAIKFHPESTLFFVAGGQNDKLLPTETTVENLKSDIRILYRSGGRRFMVAVLPTLIPEFREVNMRLNPALTRIPQELAAELPDASVSLSRWGAYFDDVMLNPAKYGIDNTTDTCAGRAIFGEDPRPCPKPASYFYYHSGHPSTAVHEIVGERLYQEVQKLSPLP
jgi:cholinesterase